MSSWKPIPSNFEIIYTRIFPLRLESELNIHQHWTKSAKRHRIQHQTVMIFLKSDRPMIAPPCTIYLTRIAPCAFDYDNLVGAFKYVKDAIADFIHPGKVSGRADDDNLIQWIYSQRKGKPKEYAIEIVVKK